MNPLICSGIASGVLLPALFFFIELCIELKFKGRAEAEGRVIWWSLSPERKKRDYRTGELIATGEEVSFEGRHGHYMKCGEIAITLSSASLVFIPSLNFATRLPWIGFSMILLGFTVVWSLCFIGLMTYFYEMELQDPQSFTLYRSCTLFSLGFGALACFATAYFTFAWSIGNALANGTFISVRH